MRKRRNEKLRNQEKEKKGYHGDQRNQRYQGMRLGDPSDISDSSDNFDRNFIDIVAV